MCDVKTSTDRHINTKDEPFECWTIEGSDDFLKYTEKVFKFCSGIISVECQVQAKKTKVKPITYCIYIYIYSENTKSDRLNQCQFNS